MSKQALYRMSNRIRKQPLVASLLVCGVVLSLTTAYLGVRWHQALRIEENMVWSCGSTAGSLSDPTPDCPDPRTTIDHEYERSLAETALGAAGLFVGAFVVYRRH